MMNKWALFKKKKKHKHKQNPKEQTSKQKTPCKNKLTEKNPNNTKKNPPIITYQLAAGIDFCEKYLEISKWESGSFFSGLRQGHIKFLLSNPEKHIKRDLGRLNSLQITFNLYASSDRGCALHIGSHLREVAISKVFQYCERFSAN